MKKGQRAAKMKSAESDIRRWVNTITAAQKKGLPSKEAHAKVQLKKAQEELKHLRSQPDD